MIELYQQQRAMRAMRSAAIQRGVIAILDIGTSKIGCLVLRFDGPEQFRDTDGVGSLAGQSAFRVIGAATTRSRGVRFGEIDAMGETERAIRTAVQQAQKMAQTRVDHVIATFSGAHPRSYGLAGSVELDRRDRDRRRHRPGARRLRDARHRPGPRSAACPAGQLRARPPHRAGRSARPGRQPAVGRHARAHRRCRRGAQRALLHPRCDLEVAGLASLGLRLRASPRWSRTSRSWARPASTWAAAPPACRSSSRST